MRPSPGSAAYDVSHSVSAIQYVRAPEKALAWATQAPLNRYAYCLTPRGFAEKGRLTAEYLTLSLDFFRRARRDCAALLAACDARGWRRVALAGAGELAEIAVLGATETKIEIVAVIDAAGGRSCAGRPAVRDLAAVLALAGDGPLDAILATYHGNQSSMHDLLVDHENNTLTVQAARAGQGDAQPTKAGLCLGGMHCGAEDLRRSRGDARDRSGLAASRQPLPNIGDHRRVLRQYYFARHGVPFVKARFQNVYGPGEILGAGQWRGTPATVWRNVTPTFIWKAPRGEAVPVDNGGIATRDFIHVDDIVAGLVACALLCATG